MMGAHKTNRNVILNEARPKCGSCPHWLAPKAGETAGECTFWPYGVVFVTTHPDRLSGKIKAMPTTFDAPKNADQFCGQHPEFMRWYSTHRENIGAIAALEAQPVEGAA